MALYFYDSHGNMWVTCHRSDPEAEAFGPRGTAKRHSHGMDFPVATALGLVIRAEEDGDWDVFVPTRLFVLVQREQEKLLMPRLLRRSERQKITEGLAAIAAAVKSVKAAYPDAEPE